MISHARDRRRAPLAAAMAALAAAATFFALAPAAEASQSQWTMFDAPRELMSDDAATRESTLEEMLARRRLGATDPLLAQCRAECRLQARPGRSAHRPAQL